MKWATILQNSHSCPGEADIGILPQKGYQGTKDVGSLFLTPPYPIPNSGAGRKSRKTQGIQTAWKRKVLNWIPDGSFKIGLEGFHTSVLKISR